MDLLGAHIVGRADVGGGQVLFIVAVCLDDPAQAEVAQLNVVAGVKENVARLKIPMENFAALDAPDMALPESEQDLHENFPNDVLGYEVFLQPTLFDQLGHVPVFTELHDYEYFLLFSQHDLFYVLNDILVIKLAQTVYFAHNLGPLLLREMAVIDFLPAVELVVPGGIEIVAFYLENTAISALSDFLNQCVFVHFF